MAITTISNVAADLNLTLMQGKHWGTVMTLTDATGTPMDVTGLVFRGHVRQTAASTLAATFTFTVLDALAGTVRVELVSDETVMLTLPKYVYDWEYADALGEEHALVKGSVAVVAEVTHA